MCDLCLAVNQAEKDSFDHLVALSKAVGAGLELFEVKLVTFNKRDSHYAGAFTLCSDCTFSKIIGNLGNYNAMQIIVRLWDLSPDEVQTFNDPDLGQISVKRLKNKDEEFRKIVNAINKNI